MPMKMEQTERSETSAYKIQTLGNYPEERIRHSEHGKSLKSRIKKVVSVDARRLEGNPDCIQDGFWDHRR